MRPAGTGAIAASERKPGRRSRVALALLATYACFGSSPAATRIALESVPPLLIMGARGLVAGSILLAWAALARTPLPTVRQWLSSLLFGTLTLALGAGTSALGQRTVASSIVGVLSATMPLFAAILSYVLLRERMSRRAVIGLTTGFVGLGLLIRPGSQLDPRGVALVIAGQASWALGAVLAKRIAIPKDPRMAAAAELLCGGAVLVIATAALGELPHIDPQAVSGPALAGIGWLSANALIGFAAYGYLLRTVSTPVSSTFSYASPIVAVMLGWALFAEPLTVRKLVATAVVVAGVFLIVSQPAPAKAGPDT